jgi:S1-C subfamily serine protease
MITPSAHHSPGGRDASHDDLDRTNERKDEMLDQDQKPASASASASETEPPQTHLRHGRGVGTGAILRSTLLLAVILVIGGFAGWVSAGTRSDAGTTVPPSTATTLDTGRGAVVAKVRPTVVEVSVTVPGGGVALGSGVIVDRRGYIVTNNHVVSGARAIQVRLSNGSKEPAQLAGTDAANDLAFLKIAAPQGGLRVATLGDSSQLLVGQELLAIGNPLGDAWTVTNGIVSALDRTVSEGAGGATIHGAIQTDAAINPGNSGGALVDVEGNVIGIPTLSALDPEFRSPADGVGFAISSDTVKSIMTQLIPTGIGA